MRTLFVCIVLFLATLIFNSDTTNLVLTPIENMILKIKNITENPLKARSIEEEEALFMEKILSENKDLAR